MALNLLLALGGVALINGYLNKREHAVLGSGPTSASSTGKAAETTPSLGDITRSDIARVSSGDGSSPESTSDASGSGAKTSTPDAPPAKDPVRVPVRAAVDAGVAVPKTKTRPDAGRIRPNPQPEPKPAAPPLTDTESGRRPDAGAFASPTPSEPSKEEEEERLERMYAKVSLVVSRHQAQLTRCHQSAAKVNNPNDPLEGRIRVQFAIHPDGFARSVGVVSNSTGSAGLAKCIVDLVGSWTFPSSGGDALEFVWPFDFQASK